MDSRALVPTPNADVIYSMSYLDLAEAGPLVVYAPPQVIGTFTDFCQRALTDVGAAGPDRVGGSSRPAGFTKIGDHLRDFRQVQKCDNLRRGIRRWYVGSGHGALSPGPGPQALARRGGRLFFNFRPILLRGPDKNREISCPVPRIGRMVTLRCSSFHAERWRE